MPDEVNEVIKIFSTFVATVLGEQDGRVISHVMGDGLTEITKGLVPRHGNTDYIHFGATFLVLMGFEKVLTWRVVGLLGITIFTGLWFAGR